eukprot:10714308-Ditylum_brightwellii.AAC.1
MMKKLRSCISPASWTLKRLDQKQMELVAAQSKEPVVLLNTSRNESTFEELWDSVDWLGRECICSKDHQLTKK